MQQLSIADLLEKAFNIYFMDIAELFVKMNTPFNKLNHPKFKTFSEAYCDRIAPDESTIRKFYLERQYTEKLELIRATIGESAIHLQVDEAQF